MKLFAWQRPYCNPSSGTINADNHEDALKAIHRAYGLCSNTKVHCVKTDKTYASDGYTSEVREI